MQTFGTPVFEAPPGGPRRLLRVEGALLAGTDGATCTVEAVGGLQLRPRGCHWPARAELDGRQVEGTLSTFEVQNAGATVARGYRFTPLPDGRRPW